MSAVLNEEQKKKILRQVEFYFSDSNLPRDKFLRTSVEESNDGLVGLPLICSFARMRSHLGLGKSDDVPEEMVLSVAEVLRKSSSLRVSEDGKKIGRTTELVKPEELIEQVDSRTVAASPFPYDIKIEDVQAFFDQKGKVNSVRLPRHVSNAKAFCGTTLIEFSEEEDAKRILQEKMVYAGTDLELKPKSDFDAERAKQMDDVNRNRSNKDSSTGRNDIDSESEKQTMEVKGNQHNKESSEESYPKGVIVAFKLTPMLVAESTKENDSEVVKDVEQVKNAEVSKSSETAEATENIEIEGEASVDAGEEEEGIKSAQEIDVENEEKSVTGSPPINEDKVESEEKDGTGSPPINGDKVEKDSPTGGDKVKGGEVMVTREDLKKVFGKYGNVMYVDYSMGKESGYVRFEEPDAGVKARAASVLNKAGGLVVKDKYIAALDPVTGEAEKEYWSLLRSNKDKHRESWSHRGRGRHSKRGRHFDGKRSRDFHSDKGRPNKAPKVAGD